MTGRPAAAEPDSRTGDAGLAAAAVRRMKATVDELASDRYAGRRVGTVGGRAAAEWLAKQLRSLDSVGSVRLDEFPVSGVKELTETPTMLYRDRPLVHRRDFAVQLSSGALTEPVTGTLATTAAPGWRGCWVVVDAAGNDVAERARVEGAAGLLVPRGVDEAGWMPKMIAGPPMGEVPALSIRTELHAALATRPGETLTVSAPLRTITTTGRNVYAERGPGPDGHAEREDGTAGLSGWDTAQAGVSVLLTAHFDGVGDDPDERFPAAADNASGVAVILEAARRLVRSVPSSTRLAIALLDGEEAGARGSAQHAAQLTPDTFVINLDGAAGLNAAAAVEAGGPAEPLLAALDQAGRLTGVPLQAGAMASDNRRYAAAGLPAIGIGMGLPGYQTPAETPDRVQPTTLLAALNLIVATVHQLVDNHELRNASS